MAELMTLTAELEAWSADIENAADRWEQHRAAELEWLTANALEVAADDAQSVDYRAAYAGQALETIRRKAARRSFELLLGGDVEGAERTRAGHGLRAA